MKIYKKKWKKYCKGSKEEKKDKKKRIFKGLDACLEYGNLHIYKMFGDIEYYVNLIRKETLIRF